MSLRFGSVSYPGDQTGAELLQKGRLLGTDPSGWPFEVVQTEYQPAVDRTVVLLQAAAPERVADLIDQLTAGAA